jgi:hypothetical protein
MTDHNDFVGSRHMVWELNVPQSVLDLYFNYIRVLPSWRRSFPRYIPSSIKEVIEVGANKTKIITETAEYLFVFEERNTLVSVAGDFVKTGVLQLFHNDQVVLHLNVSPPDSAEAGSSWVARGVEEFKNGEWIAELTQLSSRLAECEAEEKKKDELLRHDELKDMAELKERFSKLPSMRVERRSWLWRFFRRSGT